MNERREYAATAQRKRDTWLLNCAAKKHWRDSRIIRSQENSLFARGLQRNYTQEKLYRSRENTPHSNYEDKIRYYVP